MQNGTAIEDILSFIAKQTHDFLEDIMKCQPETVRSPKSGCNTEKCKDQK